MQEAPLPRNRLKRILADRLAEISPWESESGTQRVTYPTSSLLPGLISTVEPFIERNSNNIGGHFRGSSELRGTKRLEREVISSLAQLFHNPSVEGWITSGATESNITGLWLAREYLHQLKCKRPALFLTQLAHDSIHKAGRILAIHDLIIVPTSNSGTMSEEGLREALQEAERRGIDGCIIVATVGATETGTCDAVDKLAEILRKWTTSPFYLHVDAAFAGLVLPFSDPGRLFDFRVPEVQSLCVDLHKMAGTPIGCGVFLCRPTLSKYIEQNSRYSHVYDVTLLGSRPGFAATTAWYAIFSQGRKGFQARVYQCLTHKEQFLLGLQQAKIKFQLIHDEDVNIAAIHFSDLLKGRLPVNVAQDLRLIPSQLGIVGLGLEEKDPLFYRFYFMPHLTTGVVKRILSQIIPAIQASTYSQTTASE